jgi:hypothetical protein
MRKYSGASRCCLPGVLIFTSLTIAFWAIPASPQTLCLSGVCVKTWQQDTPSEVCAGCAYRTGENLQETTITTSSIQTDNFKQLCSQNLDGQAYAQPLVVTGVTINGQTYPNPLVYVVTQNDTLYQIDGTTCAIVNQLFFLSTPGLPTNGQYAATCENIGGKDCQTINPTVGVLGTPVIGISSDGSSGSIYLVTETQDLPSNPQNWYHYLYKVDVQSLAVQAYVLVSPPGGGASDFSRTHIQRAGLLYVPKSLVSGLADNYVYVGFSMMDGYPSFNLPNGAIFGYDAVTLSPTTNDFYYQTSLGPPSQTSYGGGIWMGGAAPAFGPDANGKYWIYLTTANGTFDLNNQSPPNTDSGDSFLRLNPNGLTVSTTSGGLTPVGYLTPVDQYFRWQNNPACPNNPNGEAGGDTDYGSAGVLLIPDNELAKYPYVAVNGEKEGGLWFVDRTGPGGYSTQCGNACSCVPGSPGPNIQTYWTGAPYAGDVIYGGLAYWENEPGPPGLSYLYAGFYGSTINRYPLCGGTTDTFPLCQGSTMISTSVKFRTGATPTISAAGLHAADALVWAIGGQRSLQCPAGKPPCNPPTDQGVVYAFDAMSLGAPLYSSATCTKDAINPSTKFSVPTVANGYVYVGTESDNHNIVGKGTFYIFGPSGTACKQ